MRNRILAVLDGEVPGPGRLVPIFLLITIYASVGLLVLEARYSAEVQAYQPYIDRAHLVVLAIFTTELTIRLIFEQRRLRYLFSFHGMVDVLAVAPGLLAVAIPGLIGTEWLRVVRLFKFGRALKFMHVGGVVGGVTGRLAPFISLAVGCKGVLVSLEVEPWWPTIGNLTIPIGVAGFALAILLGTKMRVINGRLYAIEDAISRIVGALRDMGPGGEVKAATNEWARQFLMVLRRPTDGKIDAFTRRTDELEDLLEQRGVVGPNSAGFHRDVQYVLHRATSRTPQAYEKFLRSVTIFYASMVIIAVPGLTGFFSSILLIYVLGGMYLLVEDMDRPLDYGEDALVNVDLRPLEQYLQRSTSDAA